uniref:Ion transport domain-containing protein n=1 Tax=Capitella teleta TaxID=283909 RepID=X2AIS5_CAPTE
MDVIEELPEESPKSAEPSKDELLLASTLIQDAVKGHNMVYMSDSKSIQSYKLYNHPAFTITLQICIWGNLFLAIFEDPAVQSVAVPFWGTMLIEGIFMVFILCRLIHNSSFAGSAEFWKDPKNLIVMGTIALTFIDMMCYSMWSSLGGPSAHPIRWSRPLRPLFIINLPEGRQIRKAFRNIRRTLPDIFYVLLLFIASIAIFALLALKLMLKRNLHYPDGREYFTDYFEAFWDLYVLVTTANNPDVMMPAYDESKWFALFFTLYTIINLYVFMNVVLAVIYNNYKNHLKNEVKSNVYMKRRFLSKAFNLIKEWSDGQYVVSEKRWTQLMDLVHPNMAPEYIELLLCVLDDQGIRAIRKKEFLRLGDLLNVELKEVSLDESNVFDHAFPTVYKSKFSKLLCQIIKTKYFQWSFDVLILVNAFCIGFNINDAEWFFLAAFTVEILLTLYAHGPAKYFTRFWNLFDFLIITSSLLVTLIDSVVGNLDTRTRSLDILMVLRILRLVRLMGSFPRFRIILTTIVSIGPSIATYGGIIFVSANTRLVMVIYYIYAIIGMEIFQGTIKFYGYENLTQAEMFCGNPKLRGTEFYIKRYCNNNFNDIFHAMVLLFELMVATVENRIKDLGLGMGQKPKRKVKKVLDKEILVENMQTIEENGNVEFQKEVGETGPTKEFGLRFQLRDKGTKNVETLLQMMFEGEIDSGDEGLDFDENETEPNRMNRRMTLDEVL